MANENGLQTCNQVMYSIFVRNFNKEGTFDSLRGELKRIWAMGVDVVCLLPVFPAGKDPYDVLDQTSVDLQLGSMEDFEALVDGIHKYGMRCIMDVVITGAEADLEVLKQWAALVDGFRCVGAAAVPEEFWETAKAAVEEVRPGCLWVAEGDTTARFDLCCSSVAYDAFRAYLAGEGTLDAFAQAEMHECRNGTALCYLEKRDTPRSRKLIDDETAFLNWMSFHYFRKGMSLLYAGQEAECVSFSDLTKKDPVNWAEGMNNIDLLYGLYCIKREPLIASGEYRVEALPGDGLLVTYTAENQQLLGVFAVGGGPVTAQVQLPDGKYENMLDGDTVKVRGGMLECMGTPIILKAEEVCSNG